MALNTSMPHTLLPFSIQAPVASCPYLVAPRSRNPIMVTQPMATVTYPSASLITLSLPQLVAQLGLNGYLIYVQRLGPTLLNFVSLTLPLPSVVPVRISHLL